MISAIVSISVILSSLPFIRAYGTEETDLPYMAIQTADGGYVVVGSTFGFHSQTSDYDLLLLKFSPDDSLQWVKTIGDPNYGEYGYSVAQTADGGYVLAGQRGTIGTGEVKCYVVKLAPDGSLQWSKSLGGPSHDMAYSVLQTADGGYVVSGNGYSFSAGYRDAIVFKLAPDGSLQWAKHFGGVSEDGGAHIIQTSDGGYLVGGFTQSFGAGGDDILLLKLAPDGSLQWAKTFGGSGNESDGEPIQTADGGYLVGGTTWSFGAGGRDILLLKLAPDGSLQWAKTFGGSGNDDFYSMHQTADGGYVIGGTTGHYNDFLVFKLASDFSVQWARTNSDYIEPRDFIQTPDGSYAIIARALYIGVGYYDVCVVTLDHNGNNPGCIEECSVTVGNPSLTVGSPALSSGNWPATISNASTSVTSRSLSTTEFCTPVYHDTEEQSTNSGQAITCLSGVGGLVFISDRDLLLRIYKPDGRLAYSGHLMPGRSRIQLQAGVYFWSCSAYKGKAIVR